jgi:nucleoside 2-deoxyribosyltransferase
MRKTCGRCVNGYRPWRVATAVAAMARGLAVEDFGLPLNLMLAVPLQLVQGGLAEALRELGHA